MQVRKARVAEFLGETDEGRRLDVQFSRDHRSGVERETVRFFERRTCNALKMRAETGESIADSLSERIKILGRDQGVGRGFFLHGTLDSTTVKASEKIFVDEN